MRRSMLFLPGNAPNMIVNGGALRADAVILDLEDSVAPAEKDAARILVRNALKTVSFGCETVVRINSLDSGFCEEDLREIVPCAPGAIMPPKASRREDMLRLDDMNERLEEENYMEKGKIKLIPLIETALGVENAFEIASSCGRVTAIFLGGEDLSADLRCKRTKSGEEILYARGAWSAPQEPPGWRYTTRRSPTHLTTRGLSPTQGWRKASAFPARRRWLPGIFTR